MLKQKHAVIVDAGFRRVIYPLDCSFIRDLDVNLVDRWAGAGWSADKTVMLEMDYPTIPAYRSPRDSIASSLLSGMVYACNSRKYYRVVAFSRGYFEEVDELNMQVDAYHEGLHLRSYEDSLLTGSKPLTEVDVVRAEVEYVRKTYGDEGFAARGTHILNAEEKYKKADAVPGNVAILWLREYLEEEQAKYGPVAFLAPRKGEFANSIRKTLYSTVVEPVATLYRVALNLDPSTIFKHCLKNTDSNIDST